jgi:hypothetical protein
MEEPAAARLAPAHFYFKGGGGGTAIEAASKARVTAGVLVSGASVSTL